MGCEICGSPINVIDYHGHNLCPMDAISGCGRCWKGRIRPKAGRVPWRWGQIRTVCPNCGSKGGMAMKCSILFFIAAILWLGFTAACVWNGSLASVPCVLVVGLLIGCGLDARRDEMGEEARSRRSRAYKSD